jgi:chromosome condensin MukBEF complex kleisin-like MukF subunit
LPEEDLTLLQKKTDEVASLNARLSASINEKVELAQKIDNLEKEKIVKSVSEGLSEPQKDRLASIVESIKYENLVEFEEKTKTIRDTIVATKTEQTPVTNTTAHVVQESVEFKVDNQTHIINKTTESTVSLGKSLVDSMYSKKK